MRGNSSKIGSLVKSLIPVGVIKTAGYGTVGKSSYSFEFWCWFKDGTKKQNYELEDSGEIDGTKMDKAFEQIAAIVRESSDFDSKTLSTLLFTIDRGSAKCTIQTRDRSKGLHAIKKELRAQLPNW